MKECNLAFNCSTVKSMLVAIPNTTRIDDIFTTREKISLKSTSIFWPNPFTTNHVLYLGCELFSSCFKWNTHLFCKVFLSFVKLYQIISVVQMQRIHLFLHIFQPLTLMITAHASSKHSDSPLLLSKKYSLLEYLLEGCYSQVDCQIYGAPCSS